MAVEQAVASQDAPAPRARVSGVAALLTAAGVVSQASGFITGPLLARALGAAGRGDLQAVIVPLTLVPALLGFGIAPYAYRTLPRGRAIDEVIPSLGLPLVVIGVVTAACAVPIADALAAGRATVRTFLIVGLMLTPLSLLILLLNSSLVALERWRSVVVMNMMPFIIPLTADVVLFALGDLTVATAAAAPIVGSAMAVAPGIPLLLQARRPAFRFSLVRASIGFGLKSWLGGLAQTANARADQLLMITLVPARQLGLYAVATTISGAYGLITGGVAPPLMSRIGAGERMLTAQAVRMTLAMTIGLNLVIAPATPVILALLFGPQFRGAAPMAFILLGASVPLAGGSVLSGALQADGAPLIPTVAEAIALVITGVGLVLLLPPLQGVGAAIVSLAAYSTSFCYQLIRASRRLGLPLRDFLVPGHADVVWARRRFADVTLRLRAATR